LREETDLGQGNDDPGNIVSDTTTPSDRTNTQPATTRVLHKGRRNSTGKFRKSLSRNSRSTRDFPAGEILLARADPRSQIGRKRSNSGPPNYSLGNPKTRPNNTKIDREEPVDENLEMSAPIPVVSMSRTNANIQDIETTTAETEFPRLQINYNPQHEFKLDNKPF
jgi:hypothetical protein